MISFFVPGTPRPGGSKKAFFNKNTGRAIVVDAGKNNKEWRSMVAVFAQERRSISTQGRLLTGPLRLKLEFVMPRPKGHRNSRDELKSSAPYWHTVRPDATKLLRAVEDALTNVIWGDDSQIVEQTVLKRYGNNPGVHVEVAEIGREGG